MKLTVVIVNYNVRYFLEQCLLSVQKAVHGVEAEVYVVDNNSVDGSALMVRERFPWVLFIENKVNTGFSKANNQAMRLAKGEYILLLNPDTMVEEDTFSKIISYMDAHPDVGGLGVKMVDGKGNFLPESKRGLPTPSTSFYKISGLSRLFPKSPVFNRYHLGHLSKDQNHEVEILSGAFMWMRKSALDQVGLLDEAFFMYGEDIDLSWRIIQGGWKNVYFADTRIIHYKGESTKKGSLNYVFVFYQAMDIFAKKHFTQKNARLYSTLIQCAIWLRASVAMMQRIMTGALLPAFDLGVTSLLWFLIKDSYSEWKGIQYTDLLVYTAFAGCSLLWLFSVWLAGGYDRPYRSSRVLRPILISSAVVLMVYSLLPETMRFSRALILAGSVLAMLIFFFNHTLVSWLTAEKKRRKRMAIAGQENEVQRVMDLLKSLQHHADFVGSIAPVSASVPHALGSSDQLGEIVRVHQVDEVVFCAVI
ncbi:MAG: glycosyltransferase family 2 protein [Flavobacteriales bacterium]